MALDITISPIRSNVSPAQAGRPHPHNHLVNDDFFGGFADMLDSINPLQHIPGVSKIYQAITDDTISPSAQLIGGAVFGGPVGFLAAIVNNISQSVTGNDLVGNMLSWFDESPPAAPKQVAQAYQHTQQLF